jgi:hypothetical protein
MHLNEIRLYHLEASDTERADSTIVELREEQACTSVNGSTLKKSLLILVSSVLVGTYC